VGVHVDGTVGVAGDFRDIGWFGGDLIASESGTDIYVAAFTPEGAHLWSDGFATTSDRDTVRGIALHSSLAISVAGAASNGLDFGTGPLVGAGREDVFVANLVP
jgi:hypothetical protein